MTSPGCVALSLGIYKNDRGLGGLVAQGKVENGLTDCILILMEENFTFVYFSHSRKDSSFNWHLLVR